MPVLLLYLAGLSSLICQRWTVPTQIYLFHLTEFLWCRCGKGFWRPLESVRLHRCKGMIMCLSWEPFLLLLREEGLLSFPAISSSTCYLHPQPFFFPSIFIPECFISCPACFLPEGLRQEKHQKDLNKTRIGFVPEEMTAECRDQHYQCKPFPHMLRGALLKQDRSMIWMAKPPFPRCEQRS